MQLLSVFIYPVSLQLWRYSTVVSTVNQVRVEKKINKYFQKFFFLMEISLKIKMKTSVYFYNPLRRIIALILSNTEFTLSFR